MIRERQGAAPSAKIVLPAGGTVKQGRGRGGGGHGQVRQGLSPLAHLTVPPDPHYETRYARIRPFDVESVRGVLVRHLVMPVDIAESEKVIDIVAETAPGCGINVMGQYRPCYRAGEFPELLDQPELEEIIRLRKHAVELGLMRVD